MEDGPADKDGGLQIHDKILEVRGLDLTFTASKAAVTAQKIKKITALTSLCSGESHDGLPAAAGETHVTNSVFKRALRLLVWEAT